MKSIPYALLEAVHQARQHPTPLPVFVRPPNFMDAAEDYTSGAPSAETMAFLNEIYFSKLMRIKTHLIWWGSIYSGVGFLSVDGKRWRVRQVAWLLANRDMSPGLQLLCICDRPLCCNPDHLKVRSREEGR